MNFRLLGLSLFVIVFSVYPESEIIDNDFYNDLHAELADIISERLIAREESDKYVKHIKKTTERHIRRQVFREAKNYVKNNVYKLDKPLIFDSLNDKVFIYKTPHWFFNSIPFMQKNFFQVDLNFDFVDNSFYSGGESQDLSNLLFRQSNLRLKDILLVSRLMKDDKVYWSYNADDPTKYNKLHYYYILADQPMLFDASYNKQTVSLNFAKHFFDGDLSIGFQIPFSRLSNKIHLASDINASDREKLRLAYSEPNQLCDGPNIPAGPNFFDKYGTLDNFLVDILDKKGIKFNKKDYYLGVGDLSFFFNFEMEWRQAERVFSGVNFIIPTAKERDTSKLWDTELGNGGFYFIEPFVSVLFSENRWFNPHIFTSLSIGLPAKVNRRVPKLVSYDGLTPQQGLKATDLMIFGNDVYVRGADGIFTNEKDAKARRFSDTATKVNIIPGPKLFIRVGNVLERFLDRNAFFDFYYDFGLKLKDYTRGWLDASVYDQSFLTDNSWYYEHRIGANYSYQIDDHFRANLGLLYTFAGLNVQELFRVNLGVNFEF